MKVTSCSIRNRYRAYIGGSRTQHLQGAHPCTHTPVLQQLPRPGGLTTDEVYYGYYLLCQRHQDISQGEKRRRFLCDR